MIVNEAQIKQCLSLNNPFLVHTKIHFVEIMSFVPNIGWVYFVIVVNLYALPDPTLKYKELIKLCVIEYSFHVSLAIV